VRRLGNPVIPLIDGRAWVAVGAEAGPGNDRRDSDGSRAPAVGEGDLVVIPAEPGDVVDDRGKDQVTFTLKKMYQDNITDINEFLVRDALREHGEATRSELCDRLGLSPASISRIVRRLIRDGFVSEETGTSEGPGRKSDLIRFNPRSACVIAVDLGGTKCHGAIADLGAEMLTEDYRGTFSEGDPGRTVLATINALRDEARSQKLEVRAIVVGVPAVPDPDSGLVSAGPNVHWEEYDLLGFLREHLDEPLRIENDVSLAAIGQAWRGEGQALEGFVTLSL